MLSGMSCASLSPVDCAGHPVLSLLPAEGLAVASLVLAACAGLAELPLLPKLLLARLLELPTLLNWMLSGGCVLGPAATGLCWLEAAGAPCELD